MYSPYIVFPVLEVLHDTQSHDNPGEVERVPVMLMITIAKWGFFIPECFINTVSSKIHTQTCSLGCVDSPELRLAKRGQQ